MPEMSPELAQKVATCMKSFREIRDSSKQVMEKNASLEDKNKTLANELAAYKAVLEEVSLGHIDPDDAQEKVAERIEGGGVKIASTNRVSDTAVSIGRVRSTATGESSDMDPLSSYLVDSYSHQ